MLFGEIIYDLFNKKRNLEIFLTKTIYNLPWICYNAKRSIWRVDFVKYSTVIHTDSPRICYNAIRIDM